MGHYDTLSTEEQRAACPHDSVFFGSGAYYLICRACGQYWVGVAPGNDSEYAYYLGASQVTGQERNK